MNSYEEKQEAKRERLKDRAAGLRSKSNTLYQQGKTALEAIPFGQPILIGHHSEKSDRAYRSRAVGKIDNSIALDKRADELEQRAETVGTGGISSDDPEASAKLEEKLLKAEEAHTLMVERNREAKASGQPKPYATYQLSNSRGRINQIKDRIQQLERLGATTGVQASGIGWAVREDKDENRILFTFNEKPSEEHRTLLKSRGFKWSPRLKAWVRKITPNARYSAELLIKKLV